MVSLFSTAYFPPISYFSKLISSEKIVFEKHEHYVKQTYRSRALIYGANGLHQLIIPVQHEGLYNKPIDEVKISYDSPWQKIHWRTITSAYRNSAYFEYMEDDFKSFFETHAETLFEFNLLLIEKIFALIKAPFNPEFTSAFEKTPGDGITDLRNTFNPSARNEQASRYYQVFGDRYGFIPDLSILDLLFNKGMETKNYLESL